MSKLETNQVDPATGTTLTLGTSGDTITIPSGVDLSSSVSPMVSAYLSSSQTISSNTSTKIQYNTEFYDTDSAYDNSTNYRFTVPSGKAGKYVFHYAMSTDSITSSTVGALFLYKNGSAVDESFARSYPNQSTGAYPHKSCVLSLSAGDYVELYGQHTKGSNADIQSEYTFLAGHKLIGA